MELLKLLYETPEIRTHIAEDFSDTDALAKADCLLTYTCDLRLRDTEQQALADFVRGGKRRTGQTTTRAW